MHGRLSCVVLLILPTVCGFAPASICRGQEQPAAQVAPKSGRIDPTALRGKVMCGYQGWFRCQGDGSGEGWIHWSRDRARVRPETLTVEMWPDLSDYSPAERFAVPGFSYPSGEPAALFSSYQAPTVRRHFEWMRQYGIDGVWLQHFAVDLRGGALSDRTSSRMKVLEHVKHAAEETGRVWALTYDTSGMPAEKIVEVVTRDWKRLVDEHLVGDGQYVRQDGKPVVEVFGFYRNQPHNPMNPQIARQLIEFFHTPGPYAAYLIGGGDWQWRKNNDPEWQQVYASLDGYMPWNIGNYGRDGGVKRAGTSTWANDLRQCKSQGKLWVPTVYPGFSWDNLQRKPAGSTLIDRRGGKFLWEQFAELRRLGADTVFVAMFDEVDEGTAIFKVTNAPPTQGHFVTYDGLPSDWYLRLVGEGTRMIRGEGPVSDEIPIKP